MTDNKKSLCWAALFFVIIVVSAIVILARMNSPYHGKTAKITQDGAVIRTIDLEHVSEPYEFTVTNKNGGQNTIRVEPRKIAVISASCPDKICVNRGFIDNSMLPITCLPNRLSVVITDDAYYSDIDAVTGGDTF